MPTPIIQPDPTAQAQAPVEEPKVLDPATFLAETEQTKERPPFDPDEFLGLKVDAPAPSPLMKDESEQVIDATQSMTEPVAMPDDPAFEQRTWTDDLKGYGIGVVQRAKELFTKRLPETFDPTEVDPDAVTNPLAVTGIGIQKAASGLAGGIADAPRAVAEAMNTAVDFYSGDSGTDIYTSPEWMGEFSEAMNWYADTLDAKGKESVANALKDGDTAKAITRKLSTITGDTIGAVMFYRGLGINPFSSQAQGGGALATSGKRLAHAAAYGLVKGGLGTTGDVDQRTQAAAITTAYMATMAVSPWFGKLAEKLGAGPMLSALATKAVDFYANTEISIHTGAYKDAKERAKQVKEEYGLTPDRFKLFGVETDAIELMEYSQVALPDGYFSAMTSGFGRAAGTTEQGRTVTVNKDAAYRFNEQNNTRAQQLVEEARGDLQGAQTREEREIARARIEQGLSTIQDAQAQRESIDSAPGERVMFENPNNKADRVSMRVSQDLVRKDEEMLMTVHHGTPHRFEPEPNFPNGRPRLDKIGTGEGAQAYGWGFYMAESEVVGISYKQVSIHRAPLSEDAQRLQRAMGEDNFAQGLDVITASRATTPQQAATALRSLADFRDSTQDKALVEEMAGMVERGEIGQREGFLYRLDIPDDVQDKLLDWDKPVSNEIAGKIYNATNGGTSPRPMQKTADGKTVFLDGKNLTGQEVYETLVLREGSKQAASELLSRVGILGNKYLDQGSRGTFTQGQRYVTSQDPYSRKWYVRKSGGTTDFSGKSFTSEPEAQTEANRLSEANTATSNYVLWDQPTLDRVALLERNGEKMNASREMFMEGDAPAGPSRPLNQELWKVPDLPEGQQAPAGKVSEITARIVGDDPSLDPLGSVFRDAEKALGTSDIDVIYANDPNKKYFGVYKVKDGKQSITLNFGTIGKDADLAAFALGHERIHPVTTAILENPLTDRQSAAKDKIDILRQRSEMDQYKYTAFADKNFAPHFKNIHEFMAGFKTDMTFRSYLRTVEQDNASVFRRLVDTVKGDVLGLEPATEADRAFDRLIEFPEMQREVFQTRAREERRSKGMQAEQVREELLAKERDHLPAPRHPVGSASMADWADKQAAERAASVEETGDQKGRWGQRQWEDAASRMRDYAGDVSALNTVEIAEILGVKNPAANPGDRARKIYAEIDMMRRYGAAQVSNDANALDKARGMPATPDVDAEFGGDQSAARYVERGWRVQDKTRDNTRHKKFSIATISNSTIGGPHRGVVPDAYALFGAIETATGERGVYETGREIMKGRQYYVRLREKVGDFLGGDGYVLRDSETGMYDTRNVFSTAEDARAEAGEGQVVVRKRPVAREILDTLPESLRGEMHAYMSGRPQDAPNLDAYWRDIADVWKYLNNSDPTNLARVKFRRILHYAKDGKQWQNITPNQQKFLAPIRSWYQKNIQSGTASMGDFYDIVRDVIEEPNSDVLTRGNYVPHVSKQRSHQTVVRDINAMREKEREAGTLTPERNEEYDRRIEVAKYQPEQDPDNPVFGKEHLRDIDLGEPGKMKRRGRGTLQTRDPDAEYDPFQANPLTESYDNYFRHMAAYYMEPHVEDMRAKLITGRYADGTPANSRSTRKSGEGLVDDKTATILTKWMQNLVGLHVNRAPWEQALAKARGNAAKLMFSRFNLVPKQMMQEMTTMEGAPTRFRLKPHEKAMDYLVRDLDRVRGDFRKKVVDMFGEDRTDDIMGRMENEILIGKHQMKREMYGDIPAVDWSDMHPAFQTFWRPFTWLTDNRAIDLMNRAPLAGGDFAAEKQTEFDSKNRYIHMMGWLNAGKRLILDPVAKGEAPPSWEELLGTMREAGQSPMKLEAFGEANRIRLADLYARGNYEEFVWRVAQDHTMQGHFIYDTKLRSVYEAYPAMRLVTQYQAWTRGYMMRQARAWKTAIQGDRISEKPGARRVAGFRTLVEGVAGACVANAFYQAATGRLPQPSDGDFDSLADIPDMLAQSVLQTLNPADWVDPYSSNPLSIPLEPVHMVQGLTQFAYPWEEQTWGNRGGPQMPSQITSSVANYAKMIYKGTACVTYAALYRKFGDEEAGNKMLRDNINAILENADEILESYYWPYMRAGFVHDMVEWENGPKLRGEQANYRNYNLVKGMVTAAVTKKMGYTPEWLRPYDDPSYVERDAYRKVTHLIWGGNTPFEETEEYTGFPYNPSDDADERSRERTRERPERELDRRRERLLVQ